MALPDILYKVKNVNSVTLFVARPIITIVPAEDWNPLTRKKAVTRPSRGHYTP